jgi:hypothetical protein
MLHPGGITTDTAASTRPCPKTFVDAFFDFHKLVIFVHAIFFFYLSVFDIMFEFLGPLIFTKKMIALLSHYAKYIDTIVPTRQQLGGSTIHIAI